MKLYVNGKEIAEGSVGKAMFRQGVEPFEVGRDSIPPVKPAYKSSFPFTGTIESVIFKAGD